MSWCSQVRPGPACSQPHPPDKAGSVPPTGLVFAWLPTLAGGCWSLVVHGAMCLCFNHLKKGGVLDSPAWPPPQHLGGKVTSSRPASAKSALCILTPQALLPLCLQNPAVSFDVSTGVEGVSQGSLETHIGGAEPRSETMSNRTRLILVEVNPAVSLDLLPAPLPGQA